MPLTIVGYSSRHAARRLIRRLEHSLSRASDAIRLIRLPIVHFHEADAISRLVGMGGDGALPIRMGEALAVLPPAGLLCRCIT